MPPSPSSSVDRLTPAQFALAVGAERKWILNARCLLQRTARQDAAEARWLGLVHDLHASLGIPLVDSARIADLAMGAPPELRIIRVKASESGSVAIAMDLLRERSVHLARLSIARELPTLDRRGRPATGWQSAERELATRVDRRSDMLPIRAGARARPSTRLAELGALSDALTVLVGAGIRFVVVGEAAGALHGTQRPPRALDLIYDARDRANVRSLADRLADWNAYPRGVARGQPFILDERTFRAVPTMALESEAGDFNLFARLAVIGDHESALAHAADAARTGLPFPLLGLPALIAAQKAAGRSRDGEELLRLETLELERQSRLRLERMRHAQASRLPDSTAPRHNA